MSPLPALFQLTSIAFTPELQRARQEAALKGNETKAKEVAWTNFPKDLMVGALMGGVAHTVVAPVERAKLLLQTQDSNMVVMDGKHPRYKGLLDCIVRIAKNEGVLSLWRGNISSVLRYYPSLAINFAFKVRFDAPFFTFDYEHGGMSDCCHIRSLNAISKCTLNLDCRLTN